MEDEKADEIIKKKLDEFLSSERLRKIIEKSLNENPPEFEIKAKGAERANEETKRIESQRDRLDNLCHEYLQAAEEAKKNRKLSTEDKLKKLISPLKEIQEILLPYYFDKDLECHKFVDDECIDLKKELDLNNLLYNPDKYSIIEDTEFKELGHLNTRRRNISLTNKYECYLSYYQNIKPISWAEFEEEYEEMIAQEVETLKIPSRWDSLIEQRPGLINPPQHESIAGIWPRWLPTLNQKSIRNNDLITQILVCYTIKRALNGDEMAVQKLYDLYENNTQGVAVNIAATCHLYRAKENMKECAKILLRFLVSGFRPEHILRELLSDKDVRTIKALPKWIKKFYVYYLSEYLPQKVIEIRNRAEIMNLIEAKKEWKADLELELNILLNPYTPIHEKTRWKRSPVRPNKFNSYSFIPGRIKMGPKYNLTTWIFGAKAKRKFAGRLYYLLLDLYDLRPEKKQKSKPLEKKDEEDLTFREKSPVMKVEDLKDENKSPLDEMINKETVKQLRKQLRKGLLRLGLPKRKKPERILQIFLLQTEGFTQAEIAKQKKLSTRQVKRICHDAKYLIPKAYQLATNE